MFAVGSDNRGAVTTASRRGPATVGMRLRERREGLGIPVEAIVRKTRLPRRTIESLEADNFDAIGADFYVRGFLRIYADHLGLPVGLLLETYEAQGTLVAPTPEPTASLPPYFQAGGEPSRSLSPAQLFLLVVCAATLVVFMFSVQSKKGHRPVALRPAISAPGTPATASRPAQEPADHEPRPEHSGARADAVGN